MALAVSLRSVRMRGGWQLQQHVRVARGKECEFRNEIAHESRENASEKRAGGKADLFAALSAAAAFARALQLQSPVVLCCGAKPLLIEQNNTESW